MSKYNSRLRKSQKKSPNQTKVVNCAWHLKGSINTLGVTDRHMASTNRHSFEAQPQKCSNQDKTHPF